MPRKKAADQDSLFSYPIRTRVTQKTGERLEKLQQESACQSVGEVARMVLSGETILCFYRDISLNAPMEEMALIRKELKAIGININQQTRYFHTSRTEAQKAFYALKTAELFRQVGGRVEELLTVINRLAEKWLQGSSTAKV
ncbi:mobilization protein [Mucilaginibacter sp. BJC16-A38]|uniref:mobilization protein n=1 Tax=Mucilaginibacter phenanthrenivorans TaxID=1234842 RepID=UPI002157D6DB|nr:mobilization protein [Mucilaginibacter phenanthrenivorans]MCR8560155.1 mobilization protein [Mucilaginibacter phenanthrenivorans]